MQPLGGHEQRGPGPVVARERFVEAGGSPLFVREVGDGRAVVVLHGGPDFDSQYLLPDMDRLADRFRLVYYDQRGRGRSFRVGQSEAITIAGEVADLDDVRSSLGLDSIVLLGHSWGGLLAMEYAVRHPGRVSHLILMNTAPASHADALAVRRSVERLRPREHVEQLAAMASDPAWLAGDPRADAAYYRVHFAIGLRDSHQLDHLARRLRAASTSAGVRAARAIESRLYELTWRRPDYDLLPALRRIDTPTLVLHGADDFVPVDVASRIAEAVPGSRLVVLERCGHFCFLEQPDAVARAVQEALASTGG